MEPTPTEPDWQQARRRRVKAVGAAVLALVASGAATVGAVVVPRLHFLVPEAWYGTLITVLILVVIAPGVLLTAAGSLTFGLLAGWPRSRLVSNGVMLGVASLFAGLWLLPSLGLAEQQVGYVVVAGTLGLTFLVAPAVLGMMVSGAGEPPS